MTTAENPYVRVSCKLGPPFYLRLHEASFEGATVTVREHLRERPVKAPDKPLVLVTFHPGYAAGSYADRDYFDCLTPYLFALAGQCCRLRIFTINHPGYDRPETHQVDRFQLQPYGIDLQPLAIQTVHRWLLDNEVGDAAHVELLAYGHSMGGLALARTDTAQLIAEQALAGRTLRATRVLSAPALFLHPQVVQIGGRLDLLHRLKITLGRVPLYEQVAAGLYRSFAPLLFEREATAYSLNPTDDFYDFSRIDPFMLLEQGRQLLRNKLSETAAAALLEDTRLVLARSDRMVDVDALQAAAAWAHRIQVHEVNSTHLPERDDPLLIVGILVQILQQISANAQDYAA